MFKEGTKAKGTRIHADSNPRGPRSSASLRRFPGFSRVDPLLDLDLQVRSSRVICHFSLFFICHLSLVIGHWSLSKHSRRLCGEKNCQKSKSFASRRRKPCLPLDLNG